ncbi:MAG: hypothetical protein MK165_04095 [Pirellulaceae bacterium]|nr:hypothetical protein [Pirellulaceae bacterium]
MQCIAYPPLWLRISKTGKSRQTAAGFMLAMFLAITGCSSESYLSVRKLPRNPLENRLQLLSWKGPRATQRTEDLLRRHDLAELRRDNPSKALMRLQNEITTSPSPEKLYAAAELAYIHGKKAEALLQTDKALDFYGSSVAHAYSFLFDSSIGRLRNAYDPQFRGACDLYNGALEATLRIVNNQGRLKPGTTTQIKSGDVEFNVDISLHGPWHPDDFEKLEFATDYEIEGLANRHHTYGLGVPLIAVRHQDSRRGITESFYPAGLSFPVTAFLRVIQPPQQDPQSGRVAGHCRLELHDSVAAQHITVGNSRIPLETDLTTPLGYFLDHPALQETKGAATLGLLNPFKTESLKGLYMLEPYRPEKIPVLMVHGLWSSPLTWMEMFNDLRSFPEIRDRYQFWFYLYPTGQPFWVSATQLRSDLRVAREKLDPDKQTATLDQLVLVGHSMGGLVSRLQTIESKDDFWRALSDKPFQDLVAEPSVKQKLANTLFFQPNTSIRRVVTIGTPHRGSHYSNTYTQWLGQKLITLPPLLRSVTNRITRENPGFFKDTEFLTTTNSIDSLSPESPILQVLLAAQKAPWVTHHNIMGHTSSKSWLNPFSSEGDGVVSLASARIENVASEDIVDARHTTVHQHPRSVLAVRRILLQHLQQVALETTEKTVNLPATYHAKDSSTPHLMSKVPSSIGPSRTVPH